MLVVGTAERLPFLEIMENLQISGRFGECFKKFFPNAKKFPCRSVLLLNALEREEQCARMTMKTLIARAVSGDTKALDLLFRRYHDTMHRFAQKICGNTADADDVTQDAYVRLMGSIRTYDGRAAFSSWLYRVVLTKAIDTPPQAGPLRRKRSDRGRAGGARAGRGRARPAGLGPHPSISRARARSRDPRDRAAADPARGGRNHGMPHRYRRLARQQGKQKDQQLSE